MAADGSAYTHSEMVCSSLAHAMLVFQTYKLMSMWDIFHLETINAVMMHTTKNQNISCLLFYMSILKKKLQNIQGHQTIFLLKHDLMHSEQKWRICWAFCTGQASDKLAANSIYYMAEKRNGTTNGRKGREWVEQMTKPG